jgi:hypothetical protein
MLPSLPVKDYGYQSGARRLGGGLSYNEYIVYDETQIRIRYLVQLNQRRVVKNPMGYPMLMDLVEKEYSDED